MAYIFVVDDEEDIRQVVEITLQARGHLVSAFEDGKLALDAMQEKIPDLVILDVMMPGMSGLQVAEKLQDDEILSQVPVLMLTAVTEFAGGSDDYWRKKMKVTEFMSKPFDTLDLLKRVDKILAFSGSL